MAHSALRLISVDGGSSDIDLNAVFNALDMPIVVIRAQGGAQSENEGQIIYANTACEQFIGKSASAFLGHRLSDTLASGDKMEALAQRATEQKISVTEHGLELHDPVHGKTSIVDVSASPIPDVSRSDTATPATDSHVVLRIHERTVSQQVDRRLGYLGAARAISGMGAVLAHEIKNPLSGIRGASQLLETHVSESDIPLTTLIRDEVDRICGLVDRMGQFSGQTPFHPAAVNIHQVLDRVHQIAANGFAKHVHFVTNYDPSLPPVSGERDHLIQIFLNLVKNAAEAVPLKGGEVCLTTAYRPGVGLSLSGEQAPRHLPLVVEVTDNGPGIPDDIRDYLFDPFVTTKPHGSGLGLALSAKIVGDHGGMIDFDSEPGRSTFRVLLPFHSDHGDRVDAEAGEAPL